MLCRTCGEERQADDFYKGRLSCKECVRANVKHRARTNPKVQEYDRARAKLPNRREHAADISRRWRQENPAAYKAQTALNNALRDGRIIKRPCELCERADVHAHHRDYSRPLDVIWLCPKCHHRLHAVFPELEGANKVSA